MRDYEYEASALYEGGWRSEDKYDLISAYGMSEEEADTICEILESYEREVK